MNINELNDKLKSIEEREKELAEKVLELETTRKNQENNQLTMVGKDPKPVAKSEEQVKLENERNSLIVQKNKIHNAIATYNQLKSQAEKTDNKVMTSIDFNASLKELDAQRKEYADKIESLEKERKEKEQNQLRLVGQDPKPVAKSEEQIRLEKLKQETEIKFQRLASNINAYYRIIKELDNIKNEPDFDKYISTYNTLIYKANRSGLPAQLIIDLMTNGMDKEKEQDNNQNVSQSAAQQVEQQAQSVQENKPQTIEAKKTREEEIYALLAESAKRLKQALDENNSEAIAQERSYRQQLLAELDEMKQAAIQKQKDEQIEKINTLLAESAKRLQKAIAENNEEAIAQERSYRQQLLNKIAEINGVQLNEPKETAVVSTAPAQVEEEIKDDSYGEDKNIYATEEPEEDDVDPELDELSDGEIQERIAELESKRKKLDDEIIKIDLNAPWDETYEKMAEFIEMGKEIKKLKDLLPEVIENIVPEQEEKIEEITVEEKPVVEQKTTVVPVEEPKIIEEKKESRVVKFKNFITETIPKHAVRIYFAARKAVDDLLHRNDSLEITSDIEDIENNKVTPKVTEGSTYYSDISFSKAVKDINELNPNANISTMEGNQSVIYSTVPVEQLKLPEGFYYNEKNGITNKHNTKSGAYLAIDVIVKEKEKNEEPISIIEDEDIENNKVTPKVTEGSTYFSDANFTKTVNEISQLNPSANISTMEGNQSVIFSTVPVEQLKLPEGFYYNEKNGITNKHNTKSGAYLAIDVIVKEKEKTEEPISIIEDEDVTKDFTKVEDDLSKTALDLEKMKEIIEKYKEDVLFKFGDEQKSKTL